MNLEKESFGLLRKEFTKCHRGGKAENKILSLASTSLAA
jgi:hypothetical protein